MRMDAKYFLGSLAALMVGCQGNSTPAPTTPAAGTSTTSTTPAAAPKGKVDKLKIEDVTVGHGPGAEDGDQLSMIYTGTTADGTVFDSNDKPDGKPFKFKLGAGSVIKGWDKGLVGIKVGGERKLSIPSDLAYGSSSPSPKIPANSDLFFDVKLKGLRKKADLGQVLAEDKKIGSGQAAKKGDSCSVTYVATDADTGEIIDDKFKDKPFEVVIGSGSAQAAVESGIIGMKKGGVRVLTIPGTLMTRSPSVDPTETIVVELHLTALHSK